MKNDFLPSSVPPYHEELDRIPGKFHELRIAMREMGSVALPHPHLGFGDDKLNIVVDWLGLTNDNAAKVARVLLKKAA